MLSQITITDRSVLIQLTIKSIDIFKSAQVRKEIIPTIEAHRDKQIIIDIEMLLNFSSSVMVTIMEAAKLVEPQKIILRNCRPSIKIALELAEVSELFILR